MRLYEYAQENGFETKEVMQAAEVLGFDKTSASSGISEDEEQQLNQYFQQQKDAEGDEEDPETTDQAAVASDATSSDSAADVTSETPAFDAESGDESRNDESAPTADPETSDAASEDPATASSDPETNDPEESDPEKEDAVPGADFDGAEVVEKDQRAGMIKVESLRQMVHDAAFEGNELVVTHNGFEARPKRRPPTGEELTIELPPIEIPPGKLYCPRHIDIRLKPEQARALQTLLFSLQSDDVAVKSGHDAVRWLIDQAAEAIETRD